MDLSRQNNVPAFEYTARLFITFLPKSKCLLISWLQSPSAVILETPKIKSVTVSPSWPSDMAKRKKKKGVHIGIELVNIVLWFL